MVTIFQAWLLKGDLYLLSQDFVGYFMFYQESFGVCINSVQDVVMCYHVDNGS